LGHVTPWGEGQLSGLQFLGQGDFFSVTLREGKKRKKPKNQTAGPIAKFCWDFIPWPVEK